MPRGVARDMPDRTADLLVAVIVRPALFVFWSLILWGTLTLALFLWSVVSEGPGTALARVLPGPGRGFWAWLNAALMVAAALVWSAVVYAVRARRR